MFYFTQFIIILVATASVFLFDLAKEYVEIGYGLHPGLAFALAIVALVSAAGTIHCFYKAHESN